MIVILIFIHVTINHLTSPRIDYIYIKNKAKSILSLQTQGIELDSLAPQSILHPSL
jgi:hypothetical protein